MLFGILIRVAVTAAFTLTMSSFMTLTAAEELCSIPPNSYIQAKKDHPELSKALETVEQYAIASWFTDRMSTSERSSMISSMLTKCSEETRLSIVVYGIPNKDCDAQYSSGGSVKSTDDYKAFLKELTDAIGDRKVLYVVEPDAVGLLAKEGSCGSSAGYLDNLKVAVEVLSANTNAQLFIDVGYWMLADSSNAGKISPIMKELATCGTVKGVTINTSNYRSTDECATYCTNFQTAMGSSDMTCIVDTSRNFNGSPTSDWCNVVTAGIGKPPTSETGVSNLDYFMWIKPPGESDGECSGGSAAGSFYTEGFTKLWDLGHFVSEGGMKTIADGTGDDVTQSSAPSTDGSAYQPSQDESTSAPTTAPTTNNSSSSKDVSKENVAQTGTTSTPSATTGTPYSAAPTETASAPTIASTATSTKCRTKLRSRKL